MLLVAEHEVSLFLFLGAGFSSSENKEEKTPDGELTLSADLEKLPWNLYRLTSESSSILLL